MITFSEFLAEARMAPLYHGTNMMRMKDILKADGILPFTSHRPFKLLKSSRLAPEEKYVEGVSLTRSLKFAKKWGFSKIDYTLGDTFIVIELDQQKLAQRYEIKPIQYWVSTDSKSNVVGAARSQEYTQDSFSNEYEEFVVTKKPIPLTYVKRIFTSKKGKISLEKLLKAHDKKIEVVGI